MNAPIVRVYGLLLLLLALLVWKTSQWAVFDADALKDNSANRRPLIEAQTIHRGDIKTADGTVVASELAGGRRPEPGLRARLPGGVAVRKPGRL